MKVFKCVREMLHSMGMLPLQSNQSFSNTKFVRVHLILIILILTTISEAVYFLFEATSTIEYVQTFVMSLIGVACIANLLIQFWEISDIFQLIEQFDGFIERRKLLSQILCLSFKNFMNRFINSYYRQDRNIGSCTINWIRKLNKCLN